MNLFGEPDPPRAEQLTFGRLLMPELRGTPAEQTQDDAPRLAPIAEPPPTPPAATPTPEAPTPEAQAAIARWRRWTARPWAATTPADKRIARQYKADETPPIF